MMTKEEIAKLPTLLEVIDSYLAEEQRMEMEICKSAFQGVFATYLQKGYFEPIEMEDDTHILFPLSTVPLTYYRGESQYHECCYPSLYRCGMDDKRKFIERIKRCELELMMQQYPITDLFANTIEVRDPKGQWHKLRFRVGYDGMAQHYGIKTEYLDVTSDIWTAAFFAATTYDWNCDSYSPLTNTGSNPYGVFYFFRDFSQLCTYNPRLDVVGMQPLARPGRQAAFVYRMNPSENFNTKAKKTFFRHDARVNEFIFNYTNRGNRLFPKEMLNDKIRTTIVCGKEFSQQAFNEAKRRYFPNESEEALNNWLREEGITITSTNRTWFSDFELEHAIDYWENMKKELFSKICLRWNYIGDLKDVSSDEFRRK